MTDITSVEDSGVFERTRSKVQIIQKVDDCNANIAGLNDQAESETKCTVTDAKAITVDKGTDIINFLGNKSQADAGAFSNLEWLISDTTLTTNHTSDNCHPEDNQPNSSSKKVSEADRIGHTNGSEGQNVRPSLVTPGSQNIGPEIMRGRPLVNQSKTRLSRGFKLVNTKGTGRSVASVRRAIVNRPSNVTSTRSSGVQRTTMTSGDFYARAPEKVTDAIPKFAVFKRLLPSYDHIPRNQYNEVMNLVLPILRKYCDETNTRNKEKLIVSLIVTLRMSLVISDASNVKNNNTIKRQLRSMSTDDIIRSMNNNKVISGDLTNEIDTRAKGVNYHTRNNNPGRGFKILTNKYTEIDE